MTTVFLIIAGGAVVAALGWRLAYWMGHTRGYEAGKAEEQEAVARAWVDAREFCDALVRAQEAL